MRRSDCLDLTSVVDKVFLTLVSSEFCALALKVDRKCILRTGVQAARVQLPAGLVTTCERGQMAQVNETQADSQEWMSEFDVSHPAEEAKGVLDAEAFLPYWHRVSSLAKGIAIQIKCGASLKAKAEAEILDYLDLSCAPEQQPQPRPYQGVRVKEPVKELLKRKRGNLHNASATAAPTVVLPHQPLPSYSPMGQPCIDMDAAASALPVTDEGALCSGWISQPSPSSLQPLTQWTTYPDYVSHEAASCPYTADMYVQPVCPSYTLVGPSSVLTYTSQPLITNFAPRSATPAVVPQLEVTDQQPPLTYFPWAQPLPALPAPTLQYQPAASALPGPQFVPLPISIPEPAPQELEDARRVIGTLPIEKLLLEDEDNDTYVLNHALSVEGL
ncbi:POU domain class 2-associating factor 1 [Podargus strigoides]